MIANQHLLGQLFLFSWLEISFHQLQVVLYLVNFTLYFRVISPKFLQESEQILRLQYSIAIFIKQSKDPKVYEFDTAVGCIFNLCTELSQCKTIGKVEEMEKSL
jgi:hypothetical protein